MMQRLVAGLALAMAACSGLPMTQDAGTTASATAAIAETNGAQGTATFEDTAAGLKIKVSLTAVPGDGNHGMHLHATGDCGDNNSGPDGGLVHHGAAGGHWNPANVAHACPPTSPRHAGDLGNIAITGGAGTIEVTLADTKLTDVVGKAFILHAAADDCTTQPTGNSGGRIGCGVITLK